MCRWKIDLFHRDTDSYYQMNRNFCWDCQIEHKFLISVCEKCKFNADKKLYNVFLKDLLPCHYWQLGPYQICEFCVGVRYLFNYHILKVWVESLKVRI